MVSYSKIIKHAYRITIHNPMLWLFGLFLLGGMNLNFLNFQHLPLRQVSQGGRVYPVVIFFQSHPTAMAWASVCILIFYGLILLLTNWAQIVLVLSASELSNGNFVEYRHSIQRSRKFLWPVIQRSLLSTTFMVVVTAGLLLPQFYLKYQPQVQLLLWVLGAFILIPLLFAISCVSIFASFYIILYRLKFPRAVDLGTDFFVAHWVEILGLSLILIALYTGCFFAGVALTALTRELLKTLLIYALNFHFVVLSVIIVELKVLLFLIFWLFVGILNALINVAFLLLFLQLVKPIEAEKEDLKRQELASAA